MVPGTRKRSLGYALALAALSALFPFIVAPPRARAEPPALALFKSVDMATTDLTPDQQRILARIDKSKGTIENTRRIVRLDPGVADAAADTPLDIALPQGPKVPFAARVVARNTGPGAKSSLISGRGDRITEAVHLDVTDKAATGLIYTADKVFAVEPIGGGLQAVTQIDMSRYDMHGHGKRFEEMEKRPVPARVLPPPPADTAPPVEITVLVAYTPKVESLQANVLSLINSSVALANTSYENSKVNLRLKLVATLKVNYTESATHDEDLAKFRGKGDGVMDEVHALRDEKKADVCVLLIDNDQFCGLAAAILATEDTAFAVVHHDCAVKNLSFAHEIGHLQGARHNLEVDPTIDPPHPYNHGYLSPGTANWRTIMAYPAEGKPNRVPYWSNPDVMIGGIATGTAGKQHNARMLNESAVAISLFR